MAFDMLYCRTCGYTTAAGFEFGVVCCGRELRELVSHEDWLAGLTEGQRRVIWWVMNRKPAGPVGLADDEMATAYPNRGFGFINDTESFQRAQAAR